MSLYIVTIILGVLLLTGGGELLIRGALAAAKRLGVSPLLSGLIIVGFGTSAPELAVSVDAAINGQPDIAVGNVVGSNIGNILLILGICALISPMNVKPLVLRRDGVMMMIATVLCMILIGGQGLVRLDAALLLAALLAYLIWAYVTERDETVPSAEVHKAESEAVTAIPVSMLWTVASVILGLALLVVGSRVFLYGAIGIAESIGISEAVIGLTLVAVGTSLPELSISVLAAIRRQADVAIGNVLGSNIFNALGILGVSALLQPLPVPERILHIDQWVMLGSALLVLVFLYTGKRLTRWEGLALILGYGVYVFSAL